MARPARPSTHRQTRPPPARPAADSAQSGRPPFPPSHPSPPLHRPRPPEIPGPATRSPALSPGENQTRFPDDLPCAHAARCLWKSEHNQAVVSSRPLSQRRLERAQFLVNVGIVRLVQSGGDSDSQAVAKFLTEPADR